MTTRFNRLRFSHYTLAVARALLDVEFTSQEIKILLDVTENAIKRWLAFGLPYRRDSRGHRWFRGGEVKEWIATTHRLRKRVKRALPADQAYCFCCRNNVRIRDQYIRQTESRVWLTGRCPSCNGIVNRSFRRGEQS